MQLSGPMVASEPICENQEPSMEFIQILFKTQRHSCWIPKRPTDTRAKYLFVPVSHVLSICAHPTIFLCHQEPFCRGCSILIFCSFRNGWGTRSLRRMWEEGKPEALYSLQAPCQEQTPSKANRSSICGSYFGMGQN